MVDLDFQGSIEDWIPSSLGYVEAETFTDGAADEAGPSNRKP